MIFDVSPISSSRDEDRQQRKRRGVAADLDELVHEIAETRIPTDGHAKRDDQGDRNQKSAQGTQQAGGDVIIELAGLRKLPAAAITSEKGGRNTGSINPSRGATSHAANMATSSNERCPKAASPRAAG
ncbi:hypothetical protein [Bradyrhizobium sp. BWC-3-1]|uniref:hypothetical protein n=1 Tax=Bradyrhizobium sp. BWC-3-1 TaxID=3080012 RepID=UPI00293F0B9F|nr:hypothetical protein [Bradyrhizobium sp. BWC-3-1]WOH57515.1 hypothetical protein RX329_35690 [Bradyrhizobium sp. BWC-3-1]